MTRIHATFGAAVLGATLTAACSKSTPEPERSTETTAAPSPSPSSATASPTGADASASSAPSLEGFDVAWDAPSAWTSVPNPNAMRKATFKVPRASGDTEDAELAVSSASGGVEANVKRWAGQFGNAEPKTEQRLVNGLKVTIVELKGTYSAAGGMMGGPAQPKPKYMLLGAVVDSGERQHFFKMTGPEKTVSEARRDFDAFVSSLRAK